MSRLNHPNEGILLNVFPDITCSLPRVKQQRATYRSVPMHSFPLSTVFLILKRAFHLITNLGDHFGVFWLNLIQIDLFDIQGSLVSLSPIKFKV